VARPIRDILRRQRNARVMLAEVEDVDLAARELEVLTPLGVRSRVPYDSLILAMGATQSYFGRDELARHAPGMKSIDDARDLRGRIFNAFEMAEEEPDPELRRRLLTFVAIGAGPTGVEMAGQIAELSRRSLGRNFRNFDPADARVVLLDAADTVLGSFPPSIQRKTIRSLERMGIEIHLGARVTGVDEDGIDIEGRDPGLRRIEAATKIWAVGVEAPPLARRLAEASGAETDRAGRVKVLPDCTLPGHPEVFVVGDMMSLDDLPGVAEVAMQAGRHSARTIVRRLGGDDEPRPLRYRDLGTMATISRFRGVAVLGPLRVSGFLGWVIWLVVHLFFLTGFKNRFAAVTNWAVAFVGRGRPQRTITARQAFARLARGRDEVPRREIEER
jgi:NADH dehydrogenase